MGKKLAIRGHATRGKEVIEFLEMMDGKNVCNLDGKHAILWISDRNNYICNKLLELEHTPNFEIFTIDKFLEKYPFKVGDKVIDEADGCPGVICEMKWDEDVSDMKYCVAFGNGVDFGWFANDSIEFYKENENSKYIATNVEEPQSKRDIDKAEFMIKHMILPNKMDDKLEYEIIDGYEFDKVENGKIILKPIKSKYPKTYADCCDVLLIPPYYNLRYHTYERGYNEYATSNTLLSLQDKLNTLGKLIICRNAYWKIAGEQMGLGKPWEPDWLDEKTKYTIKAYQNRIIKDKALHTNCILVFPIEEIRDAFYENFKDLIEDCKELL